jgi:hypothetical protein
VKDKVKVFASTRVSAQDALDLEILVPQPLQIADVHHQSGW